MKILPPANCPTCGSELQRVKDQLFCRNPNCTAQSSKKVEKFLKVFGVKGFGAAILSKFEFDNLTDAIIQLSEISEEELSDIVGSKVVGAKLYAQLSFLNGEMSTETFIEAVSITSIGAVSAKKLAPFFPDDVKNAPIGDVAKSHVEEWLQNNQELLSVVSLVSRKADKPTEDLIPVYITGKLSCGSTKAAAASILAKHGYKLESSMTKKVQILICDGNQTSSACEKARKAGIQITTFKSLCTED